MAQGKLVNRRIAIGLGIVCIVLASVLVASLINDMTIIRNKDSQLATARKQYSDLFQNYTDLESRFADITANYTNLLASYQNLVSEYNSFNSNYSSLQEQYNTLQSQYNSLQTTYNTLQLSFNNLQASYHSLQAQYTLYVSSYQKLRDLVNQRWDQGNIEPFITPNDPAIVSFVNQITGGWSNRSDFNEYWTDVKAMYDWVVNNVAYRYDGLTPMLPADPSGNLQYDADMWQFPNETLSLRKGDCEDQAMLLCSMIRCYNGMSYWVECILISNSTEAHVAVQLPVSGNKLVIFDPAGNYYSHDFWGNIVYNDVTTEINNWLNYWKPTMGQDVRVYRVFSDYIDKSFSSTNDYITWMNSR